MSQVVPKLNLTQVGRVCVTVADTDRAIDFYVDALGFEKVVDIPMGPEMRWVEVAIPGTPTTIALAPPPPGQEPGGSQTGICLDTTDVDADHAALRTAGVDVDDEVTRFGGTVPPMFWLRDPDGNSLIVVQPASWPGTSATGGTPPVAPYPETRFAILPGLTHYDINTTPALANAIVPFLKSD